MNDEAVYRTAPATPAKHNEWKEKIPGGWNRQEEANNTQCDHGPVQDTIKEMVIIPVG